jgi:hypothetical protein
MGLSPGAAQICFLSKEIQKINSTVSTVPRNVAMVIGQAMH